MDIFFTFFSIFSFFFFLIFFILQETIRPERQWKVIFSDLYNENTILTVSTIASDNTKNNWWDSLLLDLTIKKTENSNDDDDNNKKETKKSIDEWGIKLNQNRTEKNLKNKICVVKVHFYYINKRTVVTKTSFFIWFCEV